LRSAQENPAGFATIAIIKFVIIEGESHPGSVAEIARVSVPIMPIG
jgi:hypothetical protein